MRLSIIVLTVLLPSTSFANLKECHSVDVSEQNYWPKLNEASEQLDTLLFSQKFTEATLTKQYKAWNKSVIHSTKEFDSILKPLSLVSLSEMTQKYFDAKVKIASGKSSIFPKFEYTKMSSNAPTKVRFSIVEENSGVKTSADFELTQDAIAKCQAITQCKGRTPNKVTACHMLAKSFRKEFNKHFDSLRRYEAVLVAQQAIADSKEWNRYFEQSRFQYPWETSFTAWIYRDELSSDKFVKPPSYQYHLGHIWAVMEYVDEADEGSKFKITPVVEWIGINSWDNCLVFGHQLFKKACGISLISTWTDRAGVSNLGHGAMLHFDNKYSLGTTWHKGGDFGYFLSIDLLKILEKKQKSLIEWQEKAPKYLRLE